MSDHPWMKFYPRDWRGDQALRVCSLAARGLWMEMLCIMHEASPYGHLVVANQPLTSDVLARAAGVGSQEVQALLVELQSAGVFRLTRSGTIFSKRMTDDHKRANIGRKAKLAAILAAKEAAENTEENPPPSRSPRRTPTTQRPKNRGKFKGLKESPLNLSDAAKPEARHDGASVLRLVVSETIPLDPPAKGTPEDRKRLAAEVRQALGRTRRAE